MVMFTQLNLLLGGHAAMDTELSARLLRAVGEQTLASIRSYTASEAALCFWGFAKTKQRPERTVMDAMCKRANELVEELGALDIANILWACAVLGRTPEPEFFSRLCVRSCTVVRNFNPQGVSQMMWACAVLDRFPGESLFNKVCGYVGMWVCGYSYLYVCV